MTTQIIVLGKKINATMIQAFGRRLNSTDEIITLWAPASVLELVKNKNSNWLKEMFECKAFRNNKGELNGLGLEVYGYVSAHFPRVIYDRETLVVGLRKFIPDSPLATQFVSVGDTAIDEARQIVKINDKFYRPHGDFALTFPEYRAFAAAAKAPKDPDEIKTVLAKSFTKAATNALKAQKAAKFVGAPDELTEALAAIGTLADAIREQIANSDKKAIEAAAKRLAAAQEVAEAKAAAAKNVVDMTDDELTAELAKRSAAADARKIERKAEDKVTKAADDKEAKAAARKQAMLAKAADVKGAAGQSAPLANVG